MTDPQLFFVTALMLLVVISLGVTAAAARTGEIKNYMERKRVEKELRSMTDRELWDIGINRCDIKRIVKQEMKERANG